MNVIIPVAGEGTRLRPHTHITPKSLLYVAGKPILAHIIDGFKKLPVKQFVIVHGAKGDTIIRFCRKLPYRFTFTHQDKRLGLGHAIYTGARGLKGPTVVLLGDTIIEYDYMKFTDATSNILAVKEVDDPRRFGIVEAKGMRVINLAEKPIRPKSNLAITGLYYFQNIEKVHQAVAHIMKKGIKTKGEYQITDALRYMLKQGEKFKIVRITHWHDCGTTSAMLNTNQHLLKRTHHYKKRKSCVVISPVYIDDSARISNAIIGPNVSIGKGVTVEDSIVRNSIVNSNAHVKNALLMESIVGENAAVKGGFKRLNVSDSSEIHFP